MTKSFIEEVREYVDSAINPFGKGQAFAEALIAIDDISKKWLQGHTEEEWCGQQIQEILEGEKE